MPDEVDFAFHAARLLENPAWRKVVAEVRDQLASERDLMGWDDEGRRYVSIAETLLTKLERRVAGIATSGRVEHFHRRQARTMP